MIGLEKTWLSSTIAKCCEYWSAWVELNEVPGGAVALPRLAIVRVTSWNAVRPASVKSKVTFGWLVVGSKFCCGFLMSVPPRAGRSWSTNCGDFESSAGDSVRDGLVGAVATI